MPLLIAVLSATILAHPAPGTAQGAVRRSGTALRVRPDVPGREDPHVHPLPALPDAVRAALPAWLRTGRHAGLLLRGARLVVGAPR